MPNLIYLSAFSSAFNSGGSFASHHLAARIKDICSSSQSTAIFNPSIFALLLKVGTKSTLIIIIDGLFDKRFLLVLLLSLFNGNVKVLVHTRGNCIHFLNKPLYLSTNFFWGYLKVLYQLSIIFFSNVTPPALLCSTEFERNTIALSRLRSSSITVVPDDLPEVSSFSATYCRSSKSLKTTSSIRVLFLGGICQIKNLDFALQVYDSFPDDIYSHWLFGGMNSLPHVLFRLRKSHFKTFQLSCRFLSTQVDDYLRQYDFVLIPSLSESFCYLAYQAILNDCYVLISNQTPWQFSHNSLLGSTLALDPSLWASTLQSIFKNKHQKYPSQRLHEKHTMIENHLYWHSPDRLRSILSSCILESYS